MTSKRNIAQNGKKAGDGPAAQKKPGKASSADKSASSLQIKSAVKPERYSDLYDFAPVGYFTLDKNGLILEANLTGANLLGMSKRALLKKPFTRFIDAESHDVVQSHRTAVLEERKLQTCEIKMKRNDGTAFLAQLQSISLEDPEDQSVCCQTILSDITERKLAEEALRESEGRVRLKLESILSPEGDIGNLELADIIDTQALQSLMDDFYKFTNIPIGILDLKGKVLVGVGWQDICTGFHRSHPDTRRRCIESDLELTKRIPAGEFKLYKCENGMWDAATPIMMGDRHMGNLFWGQFFFDDEKVDREFFRAQAREYGFNEQEYLAALDKVPRISRAAFKAGMTFYQRFADMLSKLSYSNVKLARSLAEREKAEAALQNSNQRFDKVLNSLNDGFIILDKEWRFTYVNDKAAKDFSLPKEAHFGRTIWEVFPDLVGTIAEREYRRAAEERVPVTFEHYNEQIDFLIELRAFPFEDGIAAFGRDITERKRTEAALRESERRFREILETTQRMAATVDAHANIIFINSFLLNLLGYSREELIGKNWYDTLVAPEIRQQAKRVFLESILRGKFPYPAEYDVVTKQGERRTLFFDRFVMRDTQGGIIGAAGIGEDITERKRAEEELRRTKDELELLVQERTSELEAANRELQDEIAERRLAENNLIAEYNLRKAIEDSILVGITVAGLDGRLAYVNRAFCEMVGWTRAELQGARPPFMYWPPETIERISDVHQKIISGKMPPGGFELQLLRRTGERFDALIFVSPLLDGEGKTAGWLTSFHDITESKGSREQLRALSVHLQSVREEERAHIAREVHDELGQALTALKMNVAWLDSKYRDHETLGKKTKSMLTIIDSTIQTIKRIASELRPGILDHFGIVAAMEWLAKDFQDRMGIACEFSFRPNEITLDRDRATAIFRIFQEALTNVARHAEATKVEASLVQDEERTVLKVRDNGKGIEEEQISAPHSFGLIGIRERANSFGGEMKIERAKKGTSITVSIPVR